jgi:hypothetical protein
VRSDLRTPFNSSTPAFFYTRYATFLAHKTLHQHWLSFHAITTSSDSYSKNNTSVSLIAKDPTGTDQRIATMASPSQPVRTRNGVGLPAVDKQSDCIAFKIADREQVHPLRIQKGTPSTSPIKTGSSIPRPLSELAPTEKRRNSPSFNQVTKVNSLQCASRRI